MAESAEVQIEFHQSLNGLLPPALRGLSFAVPFTTGDTLKNVIEARGIPHTEVEVATVNGIAAALSRQVRPGDRICVYPFSPQSAGAAGQAGNACFLLDVHVGKLARDLRALGFDAAWDPPFDDGALAERAAREGRILLTRDRALLMRRAVAAGYLVRSRYAPEQLREVVVRFGLGRRVHPFSRCLSCNCALVDLEAEEAQPEVPRLVFELYECFRRCPSCRKVFWKGSHWESMVERLGPLLTGSD